MSWFWFALGSAVFAGMTSILAKVGIQKTDSNVVTAVRTTVVFVFAWLMVFLVGSFRDIHLIGGNSFLFLVLSGLSTGASWLCYYKALQLGDVNKITPIDKSSTILTMLLAFLFLQEGLSVWKVICMIFIFAGTILMIDRPVHGKSQILAAEDRQIAHKVENGWLVYAICSAFFASLTSILAKVGIDGVESNLGTAIRTGVVLVMAWVIVFAAKKQGELSSITLRDGMFIVLSGISTGVSWLCYYKALQLGPASVVVPVDKLSILVTVLFACLFLHEKLSRRAFVGLLLIVSGTFMLLVG